MTLPTKKTKPVIKFEEQKILLYGFPKVGKSTFCSTMPDPLFLATEQGLNALEVYTVDIQSWESFTSVIDELLKSPNFKTIAIDTVDNLIQYCIEYICKKHKIEHPSDLDYGKGWNLVTTELKRQITRLTHSHRGIVFVSHAVTENLKTRTSEVVRTGPSLSGKNREFLEGLVDIIMFADMHVDKEGTEHRVLRCGPSENWIAGDRTARLKPILPLDYKEVAKCFKGDGSK